MKTFICSIVTLALLVTCVISNSIYIAHNANDLLSTVEKLPTNVENSDTTSLKELWDECKDIISVTVSHKETDEIDDTIYQIQIHISEKNQSAYASAVASLKCQLSRLAESEALSIGRIF